MSYSGKSNCLTKMTCPHSLHARVIQLLHQLGIDWWVSVNVHIQLFVYVRTHVVNNRITRGQPGWTHRDHMYQCAHERRSVQVHCTSHGWRHMGHRPSVPDCSHHLTMQCIWKLCVHCPISIGQSSPGVPHVGQHASYGCLQMSHISSLTSHFQRATKWALFIRMFMLYLLTKTLDSNNVSCCQRVKKRVYEYPYSGNAQAGVDLRGIEAETPSHYLNRIYWDGNKVCSEFYRVIRKIWRCCPKQKCD